jgi:hypothetical protein
MNTCPHTGIAVPECSCRACLQSLIERHMPRPAEPEPTPIEAAPGRIGRIRALGRGRLRRTA